MPYIGKAPASGIRSRFIYTATAAQTTFTGADGNGKTLGYTDGEYVDVYLNGVLLDPADYTATSKTSVVLDSGATVSDIVEIVVYDTFSVFNGTFTGDLTVDGDTLFVDSTNNRVGVGETSSLLGKLHVKTADSGGNADSGADELVLENSGDAGMTILSGTTNSGSIRFGDSDDNDNGIIIYNHGASPYMRFFVDAAERMRIAGGNVGIGTTSLSSVSGYSTLSINGTTGGQIAFQTGGTGESYIFNDATDFSIYNSNAGSLKFFTNATERMRIDSSGRLLIDGSGTADSADGAYIDLRGGDNTNINTFRIGTGGRAHLAFYNGLSNSRSLVGSITTSGSSTSFNTSSDYRLKENVTAITDGIERVKQLNPSRFNFIADADTTFDGFLAHEAQTVVPEAVYGTHNEVDNDGNPVYQGIDQSKLVPLLTAALQEAITKIETLEAKVTALENA